MSGKPLISVVLPVYNSEQYLAASIASILSQDMTDFELIVVDDGSTDRSAAIVKSFPDARISFHSQSNRGLASTLNTAISMARGKYIARQDHDDISLPTRLSKQLAFMEANPDVGLCGTAARIIDENDNPTGKVHAHPATNAALKLTLAFDNPFVHSSVMMRTRVLMKTGTYSTDPHVFEDHNLWSRISWVVRVANLEEQLVLYRQVHTGMSAGDFNFNEKVLHQSMLNIAHYAPGMDDRLLNAYREIRSGLARPFGLKMTRCLKVADGVAAAVARTEKCDPAALRPVVASVKRHIRRIAYSHCIRTGSTLDALMCRVARRLLV